MKKIHIIGIVVIAVAISVIVSTASDASTYVNFGEAKALYDKGSSKKIHVVGELTKHADGAVFGISESPDKLSFSFNMVDENDFVQKVVYNEPMPMDFMKSEQVVVIGSYRNNNTFLAQKILMKCPSKYQEESI